VLEYKELFPNAKFRLPPSLEYREMNRKDAIKYYEDLGEIYKVEILKDLGDDVEKVSEEIVNLL